MRGLTYSSHYIDWTDISGVVLERGPKEMLWNQDVWAWLNVSLYMEFNCTLVSVRRDILTPSNSGSSPLSQQSGTKRCLSWYINYTIVPSMHTGVLDASGLLGRVWSRKGTSLGLWTSASRLTKVAVKSTLRGKTPLCLTFNLSLSVK